MMDYKPINRKDGTVYMQRIITQTSDHLLSMYEEILTELDDENANLKALSQQMYEALKKANNATASHHHAKSWIQDAIKAYEDEQ